MILSKFEYQYIVKCSFCKGNKFVNFFNGTNSNNTFHKQVVKCSDCGLLFVNPIANKTSMIKYYAEYGDCHPRSIEISKKIKSFAFDIDKTVLHSGTKRFLDIGAASGEIVQAFRDLKWQASGIELSESFVEFAKEKRGINLYQCQIEDAPFEDNYFDYIHFWHVIEHLIDPGLVLNKIYGWLKKGGRLKIGTPNPLPPYALLSAFITRRYDLGQDHTYGFPPKTLNLYLKKLGFEIISHSVYNSRRSNINLVRNFIQSYLPIVKTMQVVEVVKR